ncbi:MAG TPA: DUF6526 family protein [Verrucomicrobiae bacterium]|nr:DUF6526 family protein [Verrucomicrobiae bacterium]
MAQQNFQNHSKVVPAFHLFVLPVFAINVIWAAVRAVKHFSRGEVVALLVAVALFIGAICWRSFALRVQDRVIRLEMRLRLREILPAELRARIPEFSVGQLVAMRFASDQELPGLAQKVLEEKLEDRKAIKMLVKDWQADWLRA